VRQQVSWATEHKAWLGSRGHVVCYQAPWATEHEITKITTHYSTVRVRRLYFFSFETGYSVSVSHFASNRKKLSEFIKLN